MSFTRFNDLVPELQLEIMHQCDANGLLALFIQNSFLNTRSGSPILYRIVDVSCHNESGEFVLVSIQKVAADNQERRMASKRCDDFRSWQALFIDTLTKHPEYGPYVESFTWTYFEFLDLNTDEQMSDEPMWTAFKLLGRVKFVDFISVGWQRELVAPLLLFASAEHVRLGGPMSFAFARAFLDSHDPAWLVSLEFDNVHDFGQIKDVEDIPPTSDRGKLTEDDVARVIW